MNYRLRIQYDGTRYKGWQRQQNSDMTIQGKIEAVLSKLFGKETIIDGAGRTDAGVHALEQIANVHFSEEDKCTTDEMKEYLNEYLPEDIRILAVNKAGERFHSRLNAIGKEYCYHVMKADCDCVFNRKYSYKVDTELDIDAMRKAASYLEGTHDFYSFCSKASKKKSTVRTIQMIQIEETQTEITFTYKGNGFLYNMVRILTGTLLEVGQGKRKPEDMTLILQKLDRRAAGETAPAKGLFLQKVFYDC